MDQILKSQQMNSSTLILFGNILHVNETIWKQTNLCWSQRSYAITWGKWASQVLESMDDTKFLPNPKQYNMLYLCLPGLYLEG